MNQEPEILTLESHRLRLTVLPHHGARIASLVDKRTGRDWMAQDQASPNDGEDAVFGAAEAAGWDECFPTVAPWDASATGWGRPLRDHGDLWGRPWQSRAIFPNAATSVYDTSQFRFARSLTLDGARLLVDYTAENRTTDALPYLWAMHALLSVSSRDRIGLGGTETLEATYLQPAAGNDPSVPLRWPGPNLQWPQSLDQILPASAHMAAKLYAANLPGNRATIGNSTDTLTIAWTGSFGIWLNYGAWPQPGNLHHIAIEPTTAPVDDLGTALARGLHGLLPPKGEHRWQVTLSVTA